MIRCPERTSSQPSESVIRRATILSSTMIGVRWELVVVTMSFWKFTKYGSEYSADGRNERMLTSELYEAIPDPAASKRNLACSKAIYLGPYASAS